MFKRRDQLKSNPLNEGFTFTPSHCLSQCGVMAPNVIFTPLILMVEYFGEKYWYENMIFFLK